MTMALSSDVLTGIAKITDLLKASSGMSASAKNSIVTSVSSKIRVMTTMSPVDALKLGQATSLLPDQY